MRLGLRGGRIKMREYVRSLCDEIVAVICKRCCGCWRLRVEMKEGVTKMFWIETLTS
jgi:hypothetical protein